MRRALAAPADYIGLSRHLPGSTAPNLALPLGELAAKLTERVTAQTLPPAEKPTFPPLISPKLPPAPKSIG